MYGREDNYTRTYARVTILTCVCRVTILACVMARRIAILAHDAK